MRKYFYMGLGCATGMVIFLVVLFLFFYSGSDNSENRVQYFDVTTKDGIYQLHLNMPKDSVIMILGEPDDKRISTILDDIEDTFYYKKEKSRTLILKFTNGVLKDVSDI